ncbi:MAG: hypothetical protein HYT31_04995 [Parcubacteria group bacterium]|nr:hypothetical protein [Parcubacteria group bacterium]
MFNKNHGPFTSNLADVFLWFNIGLLALAVLVKILSKKGDIFAKKAASKFNSLAWTMGLIGIILYGFRQINVLYLSAPVFILIWGIIAVIWLTLALNYRFNTVPMRRKQVSRESNKRDYFE